MSNEPLQGTRQEITVPGDWWWIQIIFETTIKFMSGYAEATAPLPVTKAQTNVYEDETKARQWGTIEFVSHRDTTTIIATSAGPDNDEYWRVVVDYLRRAATKARVLRRASVRPTIDFLIDDYNRAKAAGEPVTLRQLAEQAGISYAYLRKRKAILDQTKRAGNKEGNI